jgi:hypothetical protein
VGVFHSRSGREAWFEVKHLPFAWSMLADHLQESKEAFLQSSADADAELVRLLRSWEPANPDNDEQHEFYLRSQLDRIIECVEAGDWETLRQETRKWRKK